jgi:ABC-2 type transport system permease protein
MTLFSATLIAKDRETAFLQRLYTTPLTGMDFILGYMIPMLPMALGQALICYIFAIPLGLTFNINVIYAMIGIIPMAIFNIALGLLCGSILGVKQVGGVCGALLTNLSAWLSGVWFDLELVGGMFQKIAYLLPFVHSVEMERAILAGDFDAGISHLPWVLGYAVIMVIAAVLLFIGAGKGRRITAFIPVLFAAGAVKAMKFALEQDVPGLWTMEDVMFGPSKA